MRRTTLKISAIFGVESNKSVPACRRKITGQIYGEKLLFEPELRETFFPYLHLYVFALYRNVEFFKLKALTSCMQVQPKLLKISTMFGIKLQQKLRRRPTSKSWVSSTELCPPKGLTSATLNWHSLRLSRVKRLRLRLTHSRLHTLGISPWSRRRCRSKCTSCLTQVGSLLGCVPALRVLARLA